MNIIEKQTQLGRSIYEINSNTLKELASLSRENLEKYFEVNRNFGERLPQVTDISTFVALQREYNETLWGNVKDAVETHNGIVRSALEETRDVFTQAFNADDATTEAAASPVKSTAKAVKPKAKSKAKAKAKAA